MILEGGSIHVDGEGDVNNFNDGHILPTAVDLLSILSRARVIAVHTKTCTCMVSKEID